MADDQPDDQMQLLGEAHKRGILPDDMKSAYEEAVRRGMTGERTPAERFIKGFAKPGEAIAQAASLLPSAPRALPAAEPTEGLVKKPPETPTRNVGFLPRRQHEGFDPIEMLGE